MKAKIVFFLLFLQHYLLAQIDISHHKKKGEDYFTIAEAGNVAAVYCDSGDEISVQKTAGLFLKDIKHVTGKQGKLITEAEQVKGNVIIIGTIENNPVISRLVDAGHLDINPIKNQWERFLIKTINKPLPGIKKALVIAGSDKRGTAYGVFSLSERMGVSPWYYWADVPVKKSKAIFVNSCTYISKSPSVKYRGVFLNDEDWGLHPWAAKNTDPELGDIGPNTYEKIFELLLRLKANMVAPAMHECTKAFFTVPGNMEMADNYGILITTSHCEPLLYNNASEWDKKKQGEWNYVNNKDEIIRVLEDRVQQAHKNDNIYTIALRGMHDESMKGGSDEEKFNTLEEAIKDQRSLLSKYIDKPLTEVPQIFVPYKEVLGIYEKGLKLPEEITIVWPDDNYGYIKKLSNREEQKRKGGTGVYYHISYLGWPNDYLWLNTTPPALMYAEMHKAWSLGANKYWLVNVGDIKPGEMGMQLFLEMAWDFEKFSFENINQYQVEQLSSVFGKKYEQDIAFILDRYYYHGFIRKPEYMTGDWRWNSLFQYEKVKDTDFSFINYSEADNRLNDYNAIAQKAGEILNQLPDALKTAFFELIYYPVKGAALYNHEMLIAQKNRWYATQNRSLTNELATDVTLYHDSLADLTKQYNNLLDGKWNGMMTAPGFLPDKQLPPTKVLDLPKIAEMSVFVEGKNSDSFQKAELPGFHKNFNNTHFFEVFNKGTKPFQWSAKVSDKWIKLSKNKGTVTTQQRIRVSIDWQSVPVGDSIIGEIELKSENSSRAITVKAIRDQANPEDLFVADNGAISISPVNFHRKTEKSGIQFQLIDGLGYSNASLQLGNAMYDLGGGSFVEYYFYAPQAGKITIYTYMLPLFAKDRAHGTSYGVQIDNGEIITQSNEVKEYSHEWAVNVMRNSAVNATEFSIDNPGKHTLKIYAIDPGMIVQKIIIDAGGLKQSCAGPISTRFE